MFQNLECSTKNSHSCFRHPRLFNQNVSKPRKKASNVSEIYKNVYKMFKNDSNS